ncbi:hypothetical protein V6943_12185 [Pseudomonas sp. CBC3]|uniref:hypothetical protein n=1 Tax=Pseudomonas sp. CBC3 TaxID=3123318 RepID=UPI0030EB083D
MSNYRRPQNEGGLYFFTVVIQHRRPALTNRKPVNCCAKRSSRSGGAFHSAFTPGLLPDHIHCIWELPEGDADFGKRWALIKAGVSKGVQLCRP